MLPLQLRCRDTELFEDGMLMMPTYLHGRTIVLGTINVLIRFLPSDSRPLSRWCLQFALKNLISSRT